MDKQWGRVEVNVSLLVTYEDIFLNKHKIKAIIKLLLYKYKLE